MIEEEDEERKCYICDHNLDESDDDEVLSKQILPIPEYLWPKYNTEDVPDSAKLLKIIEIVKDVKSRNEKVLIFSQWSQWI